MSNHSQHQTGSSNILERFKPIVKRFVLEQVLREKDEAIEQILRDADWIESTAARLGMKLCPDQFAAYKCVRIARAKEIIMDGKSRLEPPALSDVLMLDKEHTAGLQLNGVLSNIEVHRVMDVYDTDQHGRPLPNWVRELHFLAVRADAEVEYDVQQLPLCETKADGEVLSGMLHLLHRNAGVVGAHSSREWEKSLAEMDKQ